MGGSLAATIYGPLICGDAIDQNPKNHTLLSGSQTPEEPLQLWDLRTFGLIKTFDWKGIDPNGSSCIYSCKFVRPSKHAILACGSNKNQVKIFSADTGDMLFNMSDIDPIIG